MMDHMTPVLGEEKLALSVRKKLADIRANLAKNRSSLAAQTAEQIEHLEVAEKLGNTMIDISKNIATIEDELAQALVAAGLIP